MNILLLLDMVPEYHQLLVGIGKAFNRAGHRAFFAIDSPQNQWRFPEDPPEGECRTFSKFLAEYKPDGATPPFSWEAFFPDFDRYEHYGVNWGRKQDWYCHLAAALNAFFESCIRDWKIDAVVYERVNNSYAYFASVAAAKLGATYVGVEASRLPGRHELRGISEDVTRQAIRKYYLELEAGGMAGAEVDNWVKDHLEQFDAVTPDYMTGSGVLPEDPVRKYAKSENLTKLARCASYQLIRRSAADRNYRSGPPLSYSTIHAARSIKRWLRSFFIGHYFSQPGVDDEYYLYTLHFHPEASTSVNSRWYVDEYPVIKNIAFSLPPGKWLYVKDHPSACGYPPLAFYRAVSRLPNVKLIAPGAHTKGLIRKSAGVITQTGTAGYEALVLRKPVWALGEVFYDFHPGCYKAGWNDKLAASFLHPPQVPLTTEHARLLVAAYLMSTKPGTLPLGGEGPETATYDQLAAEVVEQARSSS